MTDNQAQEGAAKSKRKAKLSAKLNTKAIILFCASLMLAIVFLATSLVLMVGMLPTMMAGLVDSSKDKMKTLTIGAMNLAGASPFVVELWARENSFADALNIVTDPVAIIVIYACAAVGYMIDWALSGMIASIVHQRGKARKKAIQKRKKELVERWGKKVTGDVQLDERGFALGDDF